MKKAARSSIPTTIRPAAEFGQVLPTLEEVMREVARVWHESWIGISRKRSVMTLGGILPTPSHTNIIIHAEGAPERMSESGHLDTYNVSNDIDILHHRLKIVDKSRQIAGFLLRPASFMTFHQADITDKVTAELMLGPNVGGHAALDEIEAIKRDFPRRFDFRMTEPS